MKEIFRRIKLIVILFFYDLKFLIVSKILKPKFNFPDDMSICISTNKAYWKKSIPILLKSLLNIGIPANKIYVFEGGNENNVKIDNLGYNHFKVNHNSFDLTALIAILDFNLRSPFWFLLHDTTEVLPNFIKQILTLEYQKYDAVPIKDFPAMNIGIYKGEFLYFNLAEILKERNEDYSDLGLQLAKSRAVELEDKIFKLSKNIGGFKFTNTSFYVKDGVNYIDQKRRREVYFNSGIIKYKANFEKVEKYIINLD